MEWGQVNAIDTLRWRGDSRNTQVNEPMAVRSPQGDHAGCLTAWLVGWLAGWLGRRGKRMCTEGKIYVCVYRGRFIYTRLQNPCPNWSPSSSSLERCEYVCMREILNLRCCVKLHCFTHSAVENKNATPFPGAWNEQTCPDNACYSDLVYTHIYTKVYSNIIRICSETREDWRFTLIFFVLGSLKSFWCEVTHIKLSVRIYL